MSANINLWVSECNMSVRPSTRNRTSSWSGQNLSPSTGKPYWRERISTVDLLVLTSLDQLLFKLKLYISIFTKQVKGGQLYSAFPFSKSSLPSSELLHKFVYNRQLLIIKILAVRNKSNLLLMDVCMSKHLQLQSFKKHAHK